MSKRTRQEVKVELDMAMEAVQQDFNVNRRAALEVKRAWQMAKMETNRMENVCAEVMIDQGRIEFTGKKGQARAQKL